jgi:hypothetical protein
MAKPMRRSRGHSHRQPLLLSGGATSLRSEVRRHGVGLALVALGHLLAAPLFAQGTEISVEVGGSSIQPPSGVEGDAAQFLVAGVRAMRFGPGGSGIHAAFLAGHALQDGVGGDFYSGTLEGALWRHFGSHWSVGGEVRGFGFEVVEPFPYRALGAEGGPVLRFSTRALSATLSGVAGSGWSRTVLRRYTDGPSVVVEDDLWRYGVTSEVLVGSGRIVGGVAGGIHESVGGTYRSVGVRVLAGGGGRAMELRVDRWQTPVGSEITGGLAFILPLGGWSFRGFLGRTEPDPLTLAEPGGGAGGLLLGRNLLSRGALPPSPSPLHEVLSQSDGGSLVRIKVPAPEGAGQVEVMGDFTLWEPVAMVRQGDEWIADVEIAEGTHHFGFLVDGLWFLPPDAPDTVPDEWGRVNTTIVIEK